MRRAFGIAVLALGLVVVAAGIVTAIVALVSGDEGDLGRNGTLFVALAYGAFGLALIFGGTELLR
jgi:hypothetical protein